METKSAVLGGLSVFVAGAIAFGGFAIANAENAPAPSTVTTTAPATTAAPSPAPEPVVSETPAPAEPVVEPAPVAPVVEAPVVVEPAPVVVQPAPVYVAPVAPAPVYVAPAPEAGQSFSYSKPTAPPAVGPDPIKNTGRYDAPVSGEIILNPTPEGLK